MERLLSTHEVCAVAGATYREVDYWTRCRFVPVHVDARGSGTHRRFTPEQAAAAHVFARLRELGCPGRRGAAAVDALLADGSLWSGPLLVEADRAGRVRPASGPVAPGWIVDPRQALAALDDFAARGIRAA